LFSYTCNILAELCPPQAKTGWSFIVFTGHFGARLGQSIAYGRMNGGLVPPSAGFREQQEKSTNKPKP
jgi:hypothetical protein